MDTSPLHGYKTSMNKKRFLIIFVSVIAGFALALFAGYMQKSAQKDGPDGALVAVTDDAFGGPFTLLDQHGKQVTEKDFTGRYRLIYFGFTYCPAICPTELSKMTAAMNKLGDKGKDVLPIFITIDPERDTPEKLKNYITLFHPSLVGLTGTTEQIKTVLKEYKIYAAKRQDPTMNEYTMDHSSFIYFIAPDDRLLHIFKMQDDANAMADVMKKWLERQQAAE